MNWAGLRSVIAAAALALAAVAHAQETERMEQIVQQLVDARQFTGPILLARVADQARCGLAAAG